MSFPQDAPRGDRFELRLPQIDESGIPGVGLVRRAVSYVLVVFVCLAGSGVVTSFFIPIDLGVDAVGTLEPVRLWEVHAREGGIVREVLVRAGDTVRVGQPLVRLDRAELEARFRELNAELATATLAHEQAVASRAREGRGLALRLEAARVNVAKARAALLPKMVAFGRTEDLDSLVTNHEFGRHVTFDLAVADVLYAQAEYEKEIDEAAGPSVEVLEVERRRLERERVRVMVDATEARLSGLSMNAPGTGVVMTEDVDRLRGRYLNPGERVLEIAALEHWRALLVAEQRDVNRIHEGDPVRIEIPALEDEVERPLSGLVDFVAPQPTIPGGLGAGSLGGYRVVASVDPVYLAMRDIDGLRRGLSVSARIVTESGSVGALLWRALSDRLDGGA